MGLSRTVSEINGNFGRKLQIIPTTVYLTPQQTSCRCSFVTAAGLKKLEFPFQNVSVFV